MVRANLGKSSLVADDQQLRRAAAEVLRSFRGRRSQRAFARRLGYRGNPITDWEHGRRFPTAKEALRVAEFAGIDLARAFSEFHLAPPPRKDPVRGFEVAPWLDAIRGSTPVAHVAERAGCSRFAIARWLHGGAHPRLPDFFRCVDALTGRLPDLVAALVPIEEVPSLSSRHRAMRAARRAAFDAPWSEAVLRVLETRGYQALASHDDAFVARHLDIPIDAVRAAIAHLQEAMVIRREGGLFRQERPLSVDTRGSRDDLSVLLRHWSAAGYRRIIERRQTDYFAYNVMCMSETDYARVRDLLSRTFREIRSIVAASEPNERVALMNLQLIGFGP